MHHMVYEFMGLEGPLHGGGNRAVQARPPKSRWRYSGGDGLENALQYGLPVTSNYFLFREKDKIVFGPRSEAINYE